MINFNGLEDTRNTKNRIYAFDDLLIMAICAIMAGNDSFTGIADYVEVNRESLSKYVTFGANTPCHDTFNRLFDALDVGAFEHWFVTFTAQVAQFLNNQKEPTQEEHDHIAIDGKTIRHSGETKPFHMVHAWSARHKLVLMQQKTDEKSHEITAIPVLLAMLDLKGVTVTMDAMEAQRDICQAIMEGGGDYIITLKENQPTLYEDVETFFKERDADEGEVCEQYDKGHGRIEHRVCRVLDQIDWLKKEHEWPGLQTIISMERSRENIKSKKITRETAYYISSLPAKAYRVMATIRDHWGVENNLHWVWNCTFNEDGGCIRQENAAINMSTARKVAMNVLSAVKDDQASLRSIPIQAEDGSWSRWKLSLTRSRTDQAI